MEQTVEHAVDRASYELGYQVSREVCLKRVKELLEKERARYTEDLDNPTCLGAYDGLTNALIGLEALL